MSYWGGRFPGDTWGGRHKRGCKIMRSNFPRGPSPYLCPQIKHLITLLTSFGKNYSPFFPPRGCHPQNVGWGRRGGGGEGGPAPLSCEPQGIGDHAYNMFERQEKRAKKLGTLRAADNVARLPAGRYSRLRVQLRAQNHQPRGA